MSDYNPEDFEPVGVALDVSAFLREMPGRPERRSSTSSPRSSYLRRGQSHLNPPHFPPSTDVPAPVIHKQKTHADGFGSGLP